jgi:hypothetical protein
MLLVTTTTTNDDDGGGGDVKILVEEERRCFAGRDGWIVMDDAMQLPATKNSSFARCASSE